MRVVPSELAVNLVSGRGAGTLSTAPTVAVASWGTWAMTIGFAELPALLTNEPPTFMKSGKPLKEMAILLFAHRGQARDRGTRSVGTSTT